MINDMKKVYQFMIIQDLYVSTDKCGDATIPAYDIISICEFSSLEDAIAERKMRVESGAICTAVTEGWIDFV